MNLLEILQKELTEFPEGMLYAVQDDDGEVKFGKHSHPTLGESGIWQRHEDGNYLRIPRLELAEDWDSAIVTKGMWENDRVKQIIVNVSQLSVEEKHHVNEALAKITGLNEMTSNLVAANWMYAPDPYADDQITYSNRSKSYTNKGPTHTPQQVLEMASAADTLIITDSSGNIIYDSTPDSLNNFIKQRASAGKGEALPDNGVSVKLDKNGAAVMVEKRKVRTDFDKTKEYSVDVSKCTEAEKKEVQQAFFDVGNAWVGGGTEYPHLNKVQYTNTTGCGQVTTDCMFGNTTEDCNMTAKEFLELVYEPEQVGHVHAENMALYAEDAKTTDKPWELWQIKGASGVWRDMTGNLSFSPHLEYRRKPKIHIVHGVEVQDLRVKDFGAGNTLVGYCPDPLDEKLHAEYYSRGPETTNKFLELGILYEYTEEGRQAAILHSKAMLGIV